MPGKYGHRKVSGPVKSFFEGGAGVFFVFTLLIVFGVGWEGAQQALFCGVTSAVFFGISALIPAKNQFTEK
jgi:hypothetical protein